MKTPLLLSLTVIGFVFAGSEARAEEYRIKVLSATIKDKGIDDAKLTFQSAGQSSVIGKTGADGVAKFAAAPFAGKDDSSVTLIVEKTGYSALVIQCPCAGLTYALSENMTRAGSMRVVLNWERTPSDLDSHLAYGTSHVYFERKKGEKANLDVDDTDGFGPETTTIEDWVPGKDYVYAVHVYSHMSDKGKKVFATAKPKVYVYKRNVLQQVFEANPEGVGNLWVLFRIDQHGTIQEINKFADASNQSAIGALLLSKQYTTPAGAGGLVANFKDLELRKGPALVELGWSRKGRFAYVTFDYRSGSPCVTVGVQDMVTDARVLEEKQCGPDSAGKSPSSVDDWRLVAGIEQKLTGLNIEPVSRALGRFPYAHKDDTIDVKVNGDDLIASSAKKGSKILGKISAIDAKAAQKDVGIEGFFESPFEPRVAVLYAVPVDKEGGYDYIVKVSGCQLNVGYKRPPG